MYRYGSLFAGAGLLDYGLHETCPDLECLFAVEIDDARRKMFGAHFPSAALHADIETASEKALPRVDGLIGGIPCNAFSTVSTSGDTEKWDIIHGPAKHAVDIAADIEPRWTLWESSAKDKSWQKWVPHMRRTLARRLGHTSVSIRMRTAPRGSAHDRDRAFVLSWRPSADPDRDGESSRAVDEEMARIRATPVDLWDGSIPASVDRSVAHGCDIELARAIGLGVDQKVARDAGRILSALLATL